MKSATKLFFLLEIIIFVPFYGPKVYHLCKGVERTLAAITQQHIVELSIKYSKRLTQRLLLEVVRAYIAIHIVAIRTVVGNVGLVYLYMNHLNGFNGCL